MKRFSRFYIDFNLYDKDEISRRIDCTIKAYRNNAKDFINKVILQQQM